MRVCRNGGDHGSTLRNQRRLASVEAAAKEEAAGSSLLLVRRHALDLPLLFPVAWLAAAGFKRSGPAAAGPTNDTAPTQPQARHDRATRRWA